MDYFIRWRMTTILAFCMKRFSCRIHYEDTEMGPLAFIHLLYSIISWFESFQLGKNKVARLNIPGQDIPKLVYGSNVDPKKMLFISNGKGGIQKEPLAGNNTRPNVNSIQKIKKAKKLKGVKVQEMSKGSIKSTQEVDEAGDVTGVEIGTMWK